MRRAEREAVRIRYQFCCGYCGVSETEVGSELTVDHYQPESQQGANESANFVYCCHACNEFKSDYWSEDEAGRLLHPQQDNIASHLVANPDGTQTALTPRGEIHLRVLHLNRRPLIQRRRELFRREQERQENEAIRAELLRIDGRISHLEAELARLRLTD